LFEAFRFARRKDNHMLTAILDYAAPAALLTSRVALGAFFAISGFHKLTNKTRHAHLVAGMTADHVPAVWFNQWFVPSVELSAGLGVAFGFLTPLSAAGLMVICLVATCVDGLGRIPAWKPIDRADYLDDVLYLPEVLYVLLLAVVMTHPVYAVSLDRVIVGYIWPRLSWAAIETFVTGASFAMAATIVPVILYAFLYVVKDDA
jgi:putative oxidoreductase